MSNVVYMVLGARVRKNMFFGWEVEVAGEWYTLTQLSESSLNLILNDIPPYMRDTDFRQEVLRAIESVKVDIIEPKEEEPYPPATLGDLNKPFEKYVVPKDVFMKYSEGTVVPIVQAARAAILRGECPDLSEVSKYF